MKEDKIFNNRYNTGEYDFERFGKIEIIDILKPRDVFDEYIEQKIQEDLFKIFQEAPFYETYSKSKKVSRSDAAEIFYHFEARLKSSELVSCIDKFICIADFMSIQYEVLYEELAPTYKEIILKELDAKYAIFKKRKIHRLF
jgi:hypothetical protein